jgi:Flagellar hook-length control protein FliK
MDPIAVAAATLRQQLPDVTLREGSTVLARVASKHEQRAVIVLAGIPLTAEVPPEISNGDTLRLKVREVTPERVTLQIDAQSPVVNAHAAPEPRPAPKVTVQEAPHRGRDAAGEPVDVVTLAFHSPELGRIDLRLELRDARVATDVTTDTGPPFDLAQDGRERLRANLTTAGLDPTVRIHERRRSFDAYA